MLIVHRVAPGGHRYYLSAIGPTPELGEAAGVWIAAGRPSRVVAGDTVHRADLEPMLPERDGRVAAFDCTFAAPKSVSVLHGLGSVELTLAVQAAHDAAVSAGVEYLARHAGAVRDRGRLVPAGLTVAGFRHRVSRLDDPHLHTHALVVNAAPSPDDGRLLALHSPPLYGSSRAAGAVYQATLRKHLTDSLGVRWSVPVWGRSEAQCVPARVRSGFSGRRNQISASSRKDRGSQRLAARVTRPARHGLVDIGACREAWRDRAAAMAWEVPSIESGRGLGPGWNGPPGSSGVPAAGDLAEAVLAELADSDRWSRTDLVVAVAGRCRSGATLEELEAACDQVTSSSRVLAVGAPGRHAVQRYSTREAVARRSRVLPERTVDGMPEALDDLRRSHPGRLLLVTPDDASARALRDRTGAPSCPVGSARTAGLGPEDLVVLVRPARMPSASIERALRGCPATVAQAVIEPGAVSRQPDVLGANPLRPGDARSTAARAIGDWIEARRDGARPLLVARPEELAVMTARARAAMSAAGLRGQAEAGGWAVGDPVWFAAPRPRAGVERHTLGEVVGVDGDRVTFHTSGTDLELPASVTAGIRPAHAVPPVPSLLTSGEALFVLGADISAVRVRAPVRTYVTEPDRSRVRTLGLDIHRTT